MPVFDRVNDVRPLMCFTSGVMVFGVIGACSLSGEKADEALARNVKQALYDDAEANLLRVDVSVEGGVIYLSGETDDAQQKRRAEDIARSITDGGTIVNKVLVEP